MEDKISGATGGIQQPSQGKEPKMMQVFSREFIDANILEVTTGTTSPGGGDYGHGGRTMIKLSDSSSTAWALYVTDQEGNTHNFRDMKSFQLWVGGDAEHTTLIDALQWAIDTLKIRTGDSGHEISPKDFYSDK